MTQHDQEWGKPALSDLLTDYHKHRAKSDKSWQELFAAMKETISEQRDRIAHLEQQQRWIPVSERLPETKGNYLTRQDIGTGVYRVCFWSGASWDFEAHDVTRIVTHWKPITAPEDK